MSHPDVTWMDDASCLGTDPDAWCGDLSNHIEVTYLKRICTGCPVRIPCLTYALNEGHIHGIWGGTTPNERHRMQRGGNW
jgi:WhiB family redox-sensing transcriptional regulator